MTTSTPSKRPAPMTPIRPQPPSKKPKTQPMIIGAPKISQVRNKKTPRKPVPFYRDIWGGLYRADRPSDREPGIGFYSDKWLASPGRARPEPLEVERVCRMSDEEFEAFCTGGESWVMDEAYYSRMQMTTSCLGPGEVQAEEELWEITREEFELFSVLPATEAGAVAVLSDIRSQVEESGTNLKDVTVVWDDFGDLPVAGEAANPVTVVDAVDISSLQKSGINDCSDMTVVWNDFDDIPEEMVIDASVATQGNTANSPLSKIRLWEGIGTPAAQEMVGPTVVSSAGDENEAIAERAEDSDDFDELFDTEGLEW